MRTIDVKRLGLAFGVTGVLLYLGCVFVMSVAGREGSILFFNSLMHGVDVTPILRTDMPMWEMAAGLIETFIIAWLIGATIASVYNLAGKR